MGHRWEEGMRKEWTDAPDTTPFTTVPPGEKILPKTTDNSYALYTRAPGEKTDYTLHVNQDEAVVSLVHATDGEVGRRHYVDHRGRETLSQYATEDLQTDPTGKPVFGPDYTIIPAKDFTQQHGFESSLTAVTIDQNGSKLSKKRRAWLFLRRRVRKAEPEGIVRAYALVPDGKKKRDAAFGVVIHGLPQRAQAEIVDLQTGKPVPGQERVILHGTTQSIRKSDFASVAANRGITAGPDGRPQWSRNLPTTAIGRRKAA